MPNIDEKAEGFAEFKRKIHLYFIYISTTTTAKINKSINKTNKAPLTYGYNVKGIKRYEKLTKEGGRKSKDGI